MKSVVMACIISSVLFGLLVQTNRTIKVFLVVMNDEIHTARYVTKKHIQRT